MKIYSKILFILLAVVFVSSVYSQEKPLKKYMVVRSSPKFTLQFSMQYNQAALELSGAYNDDYRSDQVMDGQTFGADKGFGGTLIGKVALSDRGSWRLNITGMFNRMLTYLAGTKATIADRGHSSFSIMSFGVGLENNFTPGHRFKIYYGADVLASMIKGDYHIWVYNPGQPIYEYDVKIKNSFRVGYSLQAGTEYLLNDNFGLNVGFRFAHLNLIGKKAAENTTASEIELPDGATTGSVLYGGSKNFAFFSIMGGVNFYFGVKQKRYKIGM